MVQNRRLSSKYNCLTKLCSIVSAFKIKKLFRYLLIFGLFLIFYQVQYYNYQLPDMQIAMQSKFAELVHHIKHNKEFKMLQRAYDKKYGDYYEKMQEQIQLNFAFESNNSNPNPTIVTNLENPKIQNNLKIDLHNSIVISIQADQSVKAGKTNFSDFSEYSSLSDTKYPKPSVAVSQDQSRISNPEAMTPPNTLPSTDYLVLYPQNHEGYPTKGQDLISAKIVHPLGWVILGDVQQRVEDGAYLLEFNYQRAEKDGKIFFDASIVNKKISNPYLSVTVLQNAEDIKMINRLYSLTEEGTKRHKRSRERNSKHKSARDDSLPLGINYFELKNPSVLGGLRLNRSRNQPLSRLNALIQDF